MRAQLERKLAQKEKEKKEEGLRALAQKAREERAGIRHEKKGGKFGFTGITHRKYVIKYENIIKKCLF